MSKQAGGIRSVLDGILSQDKQQPSLLPAAATAIAQLSAAIGHVADNSNLSRPAGSRRGRPLGKAISPGVPKEKVTLRLTTDLIATYRDWSWEARCQLSYLVEQALAEYRQSYCRRQLLLGPTR
jgi:hypothetical protein